MVKFKQRLQNVDGNFFLIFFVSVTAVFLLGMYFFGSYSVQKDNIQRPDAAVFDFSQARPLASTGWYFLSGDWEFYYRHLLVSEQSSVKVPSAILNVPASWAGNPLTRSSFQSGGYGSYKAYIQGISDTQALTLFVPNLACAYRVYVDGALVTTSGTLSTAKGETIASAASERQRIYLDEGLHEVVIEVSSDSFSGLYLPPMLTSYEHETQFSNTLLGLRFALIGTILYAAMALFLVQLLAKRRYYSRWLPVLFLILAIRMLISTEGYIISQPWFFSLSYDKMALFTFASTFAIKLVSIIYFRDELHLDVKLEHMALICTAFFMAVVSTNLLPNSIYDNYYYFILQMASNIADLYLLNKLCHAIAQRKKNASLLCFSYLFLLVGLAVDTLYTGGVMPFRCSSFMPIAFFLFTILLTAIHARSALGVYKRAQQAKALEYKLEKAQTAVMISQIQPHFLYNALNTIKALIRRSPQTAEKAIIDFSYYLRGNMDSLTQTEPIPFSTELLHIRYYCDIELLRFSDKLRIEYDVLEQDFTVPTLSIQPLVENAIKHGVTKRPEGGTVRISSFEEGDCFVVQVADDGVGFDPQQVLSVDDSGRSHVGLENIRYRFKTMLHATVAVQSQVGVGTTVTVYIPKP